MEGSTHPPEGRLLQVYPPEGAGDNTSVDIVAIHGLGTTTPRTWEYQTKIGTTNWLSDSNMLPDIVPSARIYTFSWNANYSADAPVVRILNVAGILLSNLKRLRDLDDAHSRPLVFVCSCFGGLIVTKALEIANIHDSEYRKLLVATSGVVFLGSPLQGTRAGNAAQWHAMIAALLNQHPSQTLLQDLDGSTRALRETSENFLKMVTTPPMQTMTMCFWESRKTQVLKAIFPVPALTLFSSSKIILVDEDSACLFGRPKQVLDAPHSMMNKFSGPSDSNFGLVSTEIKKMVEEAQRIAVSQREASHLHNEHFMVSRRPNPLFTGREEELMRLKQALCPSFSAKVQTAIPKTYVIHGMGGAGKSEVALRFVHDNRLEFWGVFWIDGRSESSLTNGFATIARRCGTSDESLEGALSWLQNTPHSWLLIIDNADNENLDLARFFPAGRNGSILVTTRLMECAKYQTVGKADNFERLSQETAIELLLKACGVEAGLRSAYEEDARTVAELLGCHALAVIQAGAAISQNLCTLAEYRDVFLSQRQMLLECYPKQAQSEYGGVYATFEVSATYLEARNDQIAKDALQLLNFYAFMHFTDFPEAAFEEAWKNSTDEYVVSSRLLPDGEEGIDYLSSWHVSHLPTFMRQNDHNIDLNKLCLRQARSLLASLSLVTFDSARGMTRMHPVSHFWSKDRLQKLEESTEAGLNALSMLSLSTRNPYTVDVSPLVSQLQPHIESIAFDLRKWDFEKKKFPVQQSVYPLSWVMYYLRCDSALLELLRVIPIQTNESLIRSKNGQNVQDLHGRSMRRFGDANEAVILLKELYYAREQTLGAEDPKCLDSQHALAQAYLEIEDTSKALELFGRIVRTRSKTLSPEHPDLLTSQHELARAYLDEGETGKAIALLESVLEIRSRTLSLENNDRLITQHTLSIAYLDIKETSKAIALLETVVEIQTRTLRPEHSDRLKSQHDLARAYLPIKETAKAIALLELVVEIRTRTLRPEHADLLSSQHGLARAYLDSKEVARAMALLESVVEIRTRTLRSEHKQLLASQHELARAYLNTGKTAKAIALLENVVEIEAKTLRAGHPDRVSSIYLLARCHQRHGNYERALELARSLENVAQNRPGDRAADHTAHLISLILAEMESKEAN